MSLRLRLCPKEGMNWNLLHMRRTKQPPQFKARKLAAVTLSCCKAWRYLIANRTASCIATVAISCIDVLFACVNVNGYSHAMHC